MEQSLKMLCMHNLDAKIPDYFECNASIIHKNNLENCLDNCWHKNRQSSDPIFQKMSKVGNTVKKSQYICGFDFGVWIVGGHLVPPLK